MIKIIIGFPFDGLLQRSSSSSIGATQFDRDKQSPANRSTWDSFGLFVRIKLNSQDDEGEATDDH